VRLIAVGRPAAFFITLFALAGPAPAQQPNQAQINAIRQACRSDYQSYCSSVPTGGSAALACLQRNAQSLSGPCQQAVSAVGGSAPAAQRPSSATAPAAPANAGPAVPASRYPSLPMSPRQEAILLRRACAKDYQNYCREVPLGGGRIIECLRENGPSLSRQCRSALISLRQGR
jgi:Cysteine rich repeat